MGEKPTYRLSHVVRATRNGVDETLARLREAGLAAVKVDDRTSESALPGGIRVMTMHRAKGLEFTHVLLLDVNTLLDPRRRYREPLDKTALADWRLRERSLLYVAATRARDVLAVVPTPMPRR